MKGMARPHELLIARWQTPMAGELVANYLNLGATSFPLDIPLRGGGSVRVFSRGEAKVFWQIFIHRCYRLWDDCRTIVDAGANIGVFSVWAGRKLPLARVLALEPFPETFTKLRQNLQINHLEDRVQCVQTALAANSGARGMPVEAESQRRTLFGPGQTSDSGTMVSVPCTTLPALMKQYQLETIDLLKMDIEGSEWEVLHSTPPELLRSIRRIQFEYHEVNASLGFTKAKLFDYLSSTGFRLTRCQEDERGTGVAIMER